MINVACVFKVLQAALRVWLAGKFYVTRLFIKGTVFLSRSFRCGSHTSKATKQQVRDAQMSLHNCNTFRNITLTNSNKFIHIVTRRHNNTPLFFEKCVNGVDANFWFNKFFVNSVAENCKTYNKVVE